MWGRGGGGGGQLPYKLPLNNLWVSNSTFEHGLGVYIFKHSTFGIALHSKYGLGSTSPAWYGLGAYKFYLGVD